MNYLLIHFRVQQDIQLASQPQIACNLTSPGPPHPACLPSMIIWDQAPDSCCKGSFARPESFGRNSLGGSSPACSSSSSGSRPDCSPPSSPIWAGKPSLKSHSMASGMWGEVFSSRMNPSFRSSEQMADSVWCPVAERFADVSGWSGPWWRWGDAMGRRVSWTVNTGAFYWTRRDLGRRSWGPSLCHSSTISVWFICSIIHLLSPLRTTTASTGNLYTQDFSVPSRAHHRSISLCNEPSKLHRSFKQSVSRFTWKWHGGVGGTVLDKTVI